MKSGVSGGFNQCDMPTTQQVKNKIQGGHASSCVASVVGLFSDVQRFERVPQSLVPRPPVEV